MSEIKGIDQIFPKKANEGSGSWKLWAAAGLVALVAAGYALVPTVNGTAAATSKPQPSASSASLAIPAPSATSELKQVEPKKIQPAASTPSAVEVEDVKTARKQEAKRQMEKQKVEVSQNDAPEVKAATKSLGGRSCDCETAELNLPAQCPDASCRQCKATCGIPGN